MPFQLLFMLQTILYHCSFLKLKINYTAVKGVVKCRQRRNRMYLPVNIFFCFHDNQISQNSQIQRNEVSAESQIYSSCSTSILASLAEDSQPEVAAKVHVKIRKLARSTDDNGVFRRKLSQMKIHAPSLLIVLTK